MTTPSARARVLVVDDDRALRHAVSALLEEAGYHVAQAANGPEALGRLADAPADLVLLDVGLPGMSGLDVLAEIRKRSTPPAVVMMTADDTPQTLLHAIRGQAYRYLRKPFAPAVIADIVADALSAADAASLPIEVVSARPEWVELVAPCALEVVERIKAFIMQLEADLPEEVRESVGVAFRELLSNAIEWGGKLDRTRTVRISYLRARRMLLYRIADPGQGFDIERLRHAAISNPEGDPLQHALVREEHGLRPGGFGLAITRSLVDELIYNEARNEVVFVKYLDEAPEAQPPSAAQTP
jgi:CheY-like chemotaxis protein/anti-sigma regulatory factor (Ser/Thr protein kinase)